MKSFCCENCKTAVPALRRGLCRACYLRKWRGAALPDGAQCTLCAEQRRPVLRWTKVGVDKVIMCQNCGFLSDKVRPKAGSLEELYARFGRERRRTYDRRRNYAIDQQDPAERRIAMRRVNRSRSKLS